MIEVLSNLQGSWTTQGLWVQMPSWWRWTMKTMNN